MTTTPRVLEWHQGDFCRGRRVRFRRPVDLESCRPQYTKPHGLLRLREQLVYITSRDRSAGDANTSPQARTPLPLVRALAGGVTRGLSSQVPFNTGGRRL